MKNAGKLAYVDQIYEDALTELEPYTPQEVLAAVDQTSGLVRLLAHLGACCMAKAACEEEIEID